MHAEQKIWVNREAMRSAMTALGIETLGELVNRLRPRIYRVSESSVNRWNTQGWPRHKFDELCEVLGLDIDTLTY
jgi:hypothetical protein